MGGGELAEVGRRKVADDIVNECQINYIWKFDDNPSDTHTYFRMKISDDGKVNNTNYMSFRQKAKA